MTLLESNEQDTEGRKSSFSYDLKTSRINRVIYYSFLIQLLFNLILIFSIESGNQHHYGLKKFYFDLEESIPTYFSSVILLFSSFLLALISRMKHKIMDSFSDHWMIISALFLLLSVDEIAGFHEVLIDPLNSLFHFTGYWRFSRVIPALIFVLIFTASYLNFLGSLPIKYKRGFILAGCVYVIGAIGIEMISAKLFINDKASELDLIYNLTITLEESFEMLGVMIFISYLLSYLKSMNDRINLSLE